MNKVKVKDVTPRRVLELTQIFMDRGLELIQSRTRAWNKYRYENSSLGNLEEKPKVFPLHRL